MMCLTLRPPGWLERVWCRRLGLRPPVATSGPGLFTGLVRLLPYRWRRVHHAYAERGGYFWLPCPLCGWEFGGHESGGTVPDLTRGPGYGTAVCSACTRASETLPLQGGTNS